MQNSQNKQQNQTKTNKKRKEIFFGFDLFLAETLSTVMNFDQYSL